VAQRGLVDPHVVIGDGFLVGLLELDDALQQARQPLALDRRVLG